MSPISSPSAALQVVMDALLDHISKCDFGDDMGHFYVCNKLKIMKMDGIITEECLETLLHFIREQLIDCYTYPDYYAMYVLCIPADEWYTDERLTWDKANQYRIIWVNSMINYFKAQGK